MNNPSALTPTVQQLEADQRIIVGQVEQRTGLISRWSGIVLIGTDLNVLGRPLYAGRKEWNCDITLHRMYLTAPRRYSSGVHEALHSVSVGLNPRDYAAYRGLEEGIVEQCTRLLREDRKRRRLNSSPIPLSRLPSS